MEEAQPSNGDIRALLSIDGGGVRGIVPALMIQRIEELCGKPVHQLFDVVCGTSTGSVIALLTTRPDPYSGTNLVDMYRRRSKDFFRRDPFHAVYSLNGWVRPKYPARYVEETLKDVLGKDTKMSQALTEVVVPTFDLRRTWPRVLVFSRRAAWSWGHPRYRYSQKGAVQGLASAGRYLDRLAATGGGRRLSVASAVNRHIRRRRRRHHLEPARQATRVTQEDIFALIAGDRLGEYRPDLDFYMWQVARGATAAPSYFPGTRVTSVDGTRTYHPIDGGVYINNPVVEGLVHALAARQEEGGDGQLLVVSLGTGFADEPILPRRARNWGLLQWALPLIDVMFEGQAQAATAQTREVLPAMQSYRMHFRFEPTLEEAIPFDDTKPATIRRLEEMTASFIERDDDRFREIANLLAARSSPPQRQLGQLRPA